MNKLSFDAYTLKWFAIIAMVLNHIAIAFYSVLPFPILLPAYAIGGLTYTIMSFFVVEGYRHTSNLKKYILRLLIFGLIAQSVHPMVLGVTAIVPGLHLNIMFTIILSLLVLLMYDKIKMRILFWLLFIIACILSMIMDLYFVAILMTLLYYVIKKDNLRRTLPGIVGGMLFIVLTLPLLFVQFAPDAELYGGMGMSKELAMAAPTFAIGCFIGAILIRNYNNDRGRRAKWLFYIAYPLHLAVLAGIAVAMGITEFSLFGFRV